jgi:solute carrier family 13 (sodium-dependent dicarboxylate transporter), member 2/3/5
MSDCVAPAPKAGHSTARNLLITAGCVLLFCVIYFLPSPEPIQTMAGPVALSPVGKACMGILVVALILWVTEAMPFTVSSILLLVIMPFFKITDGLSAVKKGKLITVDGFREGFNQLVQLSFGNQIILFFLGVFLLSAAFDKSGLGKRLGLQILRFSDGYTKRVVFGVLLSGALISMWITDMAAAAIMTSLSLQIVKRFDIKPQQSNFARALFISCAWGSLIGGVATPAGCGVNFIAMNFLKELAGYNLTFTGWMLLGMPASLALLPVAFLVLITMFPMEIKKLNLSADDFKKELAELGPPSRKEWWTIIVFSLAIFLWLFSGLIKKYTSGAVDLPEEWIAIVCGLLLLFPGIEVMTMKEAEREVSWDSILLVMASIGLGMMMYETGAARWMAWELLGGVGDMNALTRIAVVVTALVIVKVFLASNTITGVIIIPLLITLAKDLNIDPWMLAAPAALSASLGMILITQTPTNVIPYAAGYFSIRDFAKSGIVMSIGIIIIVTLVIAVVGSLTGMYQF